MATKHHYMRLAKQYGQVTEWVCDECGRRFVIQFQPRYQKVVMAAGDEYAVHHCGQPPAPIKPPKKQKKIVKPPSAFAKWFSR